MWNGGAREDTPSPIRRGDARATSVERREKPCKARGGMGSPRCPGELEVTVGFRDDEVVDLGEHPGVARLGGEVP